MHFIIDKRTYQETKAKAFFIHFIHVCALLTRHWLPSRASSTEEC